MLVNIKKHIILLLIILIIMPLYGFVSADYSKEIDDIQDQIVEQQQKIEKLEEQKQIYEEKVEIKRQEATSLNNQLDILKNQIATRKIEVQEKEGEIDTTNLSIKNIQLKILDKKQQVSNLQQELKNFLQIINIYDKKNFLEIIFLNESISDILNHIRYLGSIQSELNYSLKRINLIKQGLETQEKSMRTGLQDLIELKDELQDKEAKLDSEKQATQNILYETRGAEWKFQSLLAEVIAERQAVENEIASLEKSIRAKLALQGDEQTAELMEEQGIIVFSWPVPNNGITSPFHDPDYPYRGWLGEHSGTDIRAAQGTNIRAAASGYIARAKHGGLGYSYVMIIHNDEFSTVYGHVSEILVQEGEYVTRGQIIAKSGGMPGTSGAGNFSTGPHLHFEVRLNGIPVNAEDYLL